MDGGGGSTEIEYGWFQSYVEGFTKALMSQLGVTEATTCSSGTGHRPAELWSATNIGLVRLRTTSDWDGVEAVVTPWREVRGVELTAHANETNPDPTAVFKIVEPALEIELTRRSSLGGPRSQQWPFVLAVLSHIGSGHTR
ncbi:MAG TPA: hypothetical protein VIJ07_06725 [Dermatophilaceae bacterium]|jgi:hypothetical protein